MLGTLFDTMAGVMAIPLIFAIGQWLLGIMMPALFYVLPWTLFAPAGDDYPALASSLIIGDAPFSWMPLIWALIFSAVFTTAAIIRFDRQEF